MTNEPIYPQVKKPSGCWRLSGCLLTAVSVFLIIFTIYLIIDAERHMDERRAEYAASSREYEEALAAYNADSVYNKAQYERILTQMAVAKQRRDSALIASLQDSLLAYAVPEFIPRGAIGFNIAGAFYVLFILILLIPLTVGILLLLYYRYKKRKYNMMNYEP